MTGQRSPRGATRSPEHCYQQAGLPLPKSAIRHGRRSLSLIAKPLGAAEAIRAIRREKVDYVTDRAQKAKTGRIIDASDEAEYDDVLARERALVSGHADMRYAGFITLTAESLDELHTAVAATRRAANQCMLETRPLLGRQAQGFLAAALPLGRTVG